MIKVKCNTKNEALSISGEMNDDAVVAQSTFCFNSKKNCGVLRCFWQSSRENIRMSCIKSCIMSWIMSCIICIGIAIVILVITGTIRCQSREIQTHANFFQHKGKSHRVCQRVHERLHQHFQLFKIHSMWRTKCWALV